MQAASIGAMFLTTMAGPIDAAELSMYSALLMDSSNGEMVEFLMAGMWIMLRNPENRKALGTSFAVNPACPAAAGMASKLNDAIMLHDINEQALEQVWGGVGDWVCGVCGLHTSLWRGHGARGANLSTLVAVIVARISTPLWYPVSQFVVGFWRFYKINVWCEILLSAG